MSKLFSLLFSLLFLCIFTLQAQVITYDGTLDSKLISGEVFFYVQEKEDSISVNEISSSQMLRKFERSSEQVLNFGPKKTTFWLHFTVNNTGSSPIYLEFEQALMPFVNVYTRTNPGDEWTLKQSGHTIHLEEKPFKSHWQIFPIPNECEVFVHAQTSGLPVPINICKASSYDVTAVNQKVIYGIYVGFMLFIILHNFFLAVSIKNYIYLFYAFLTCTYTLFSSLNDGYLVYFLHQGDFSKWYSWISIFNQPAGFLYGLLFLETKKYAPSFNKVACLFLVYFASYILWHPLLAFEHVNIINNIHALLGILFMTGAGILVGLKGNKVGYYFSAAYLVMFVIASMEVSFKRTGSPTYFFEISHVSTAVFVEVFMLAYILTKRFEWEKIRIEEEKRDAQNAAIEQIKENERIVREQNALLEQKVMERTVELVEKNEEILQQHEELTVTTEKLQQQHELLVHWQTDIKASITYAKRIQDTFFPPPRLLKASLHDYFVYFKPRDIVSGDFYWISHKEDKSVVVVADCTGHGVPGAFMSLLGANLLEKIVNEHQVSSPDQVLNNLKRGIRLVLKQESSDTHDGMDIAICTLHHKDKIVEFASAKRPLIFFKDGNMFEIKGDSITIGGGTQKHLDKQFTKHQIQIDQPTRFYLFSDGFVDQFGSDDRGKFMIRRFRSLLTSIQSISMSAQSEKLDQAFEDWKLNEKQIDDVLVLGFEIS